MTQDPNKPKNEINSQKMDDLFWWIMLSVAVLAVPTLGISVALTFPVGELTQMAIFVLTCWASVWAGMWLMRKSYEKNRK